MRTIHFRLLAFAIFGCSSAGHVPVPATLDSSGNLLVANQNSSSATVIDLRSGATTHIGVPAGPHEAAISGSGRVGVVTIYGHGTPGNELAVVDMVAGTLLRTLSLGT
jgi:hypothetical protein